MPREDLRHVVVIGGGFGGLQVAKYLSDAPVRITLIDRRNFHLFQPLLYQVATGGLSPGNIATPLRYIFKHQKNVGILLAEVTAIDPVNRCVTFQKAGIREKEELEYDFLVLATGSCANYFDHGDWSKLAPGLKTIEDALDIRRRILSAFEAAESATDPEQIQALLTFVIIGSGPTGVELAGALKEIARHTLKHEFRSIDPSKARVLLLERGERILSAYPPELSEKARLSLEELGVTVRTDATVKAIDEIEVRIETAAGEERIGAYNVIWTAGVQASGLAADTARQTGAKLDGGGRIHVEADLSLAGFPNVFAIGDAAHAQSDGGRPLPGIAPVAIQQGRHVAETIRRRLVEMESLPFAYRDRGAMATIGRSAAVAQLGRLQLSGLVAWLAWLFIHLANIIQFQNRLLVMLQWSWSYLTWNRSAMIITGYDGKGWRPKE